ncbi:MULTISPECIES: hypothetical protein [Bacillaceae]|uniref:hypothetical protein n=1 Tax=Bacillaceae TaxID=186817 RepID=UPI002A1099C2|nr:hypothetical protein [Cytobacillus sp. IB215316]MDX8362057.1 hypothetical protein [Cytobacillus sp. IB215316]
MKKRVYMNKRNLSSLKLNNDGKIRVVEQAQPMDSTEVELCVSKTENQLMIPTSSNNTLTPYTAESYETHLPITKSYEQPTHTFSKRISIRSENGNSIIKY